LGFDISDVKEFESEIVKIRRRIHAYPELSYEEYETSALVARKLRTLGISVRTKVGGTGVVGLLKGAHAGNVVALRADMDALPVTENLVVPFKSTRPGVMHACGHDTHVSMLLGAAMLLSKRRNDLSGQVKFLFQPAEEAGGKGGAKPMIEDGAMNHPKVDYVFGLHIYGDVPSKVFALRSGPAMAAPDTFRIRIIGKGGHGSAPHEAVDPIFVAAQVVTALQGVTSRLIDQREPLVVSVCSIHSGTKDNIIPDEARLEGTIRTFNEKTRVQAKKYVRQVAESVSKAFKARAEVDFKPDEYPVTANDPAVTRRVVSVLKRIHGTRTIACKQLMGAEDFSRFLQKAPGTFYFLGTKNSRKGCVSTNHSSEFKVDEDVLKYGSLSLANLAYEFGRAN
jgi:carboxypeptidase Ss1